MLNFFVRVAYALIGATLGVIFLPSLFELLSVNQPWLTNAYTSALIGAILLYLLSLALADPTVRSIKWLEEKLMKAPVLDLLFGTVGMIIGLIVAFLLTFAIGAIQIPVITDILPVILSILLGYLGFQVGFQKREELIQTFTRSGEKKKDGAPSSAEAAASQKILDTSVIIDGRIADISETGFLEGELVIPQFVLTELQHIADSSDSLKRTKGRRGLDILKRIQNDRQTVITDEDFDDVNEVDMKLVRLAKKNGGVVVTNDFNLNKVCDLHNVRVLNINDLANAVKPVVIPGEEMRVTVIKEGKESNQGVAYLDDGTMIVIENGKHQIGKTLTVAVTSVLQTSAGRMIFARPRDMKAKN
ncbi:PIN/TRAM domain-containing protein [Bhargavaea ginsengi]|uniref:PIN/TRAM domain-containing protein n=1 Tax=Bhargavaea ginsengi TaxID=426757 RepID=UPI00203CA5F9|nr:PIN/TRAM domain-containing protein [Bhargavaea ginsengi]MCM3086943.1 PIN/TRAM domain-containing protein [Bhargavaea ginsengi]